MSKLYLFALLVASLLSAGCAHSLASPASNRLLLTDLNTRQARDEAALYEVNRKADTVARVATRRYRRTLVARRAWTESRANVIALRRLTKIARDQLRKLSQRINRLSIAVSARKNEMRRSRRLRAARRALDSSLRQLEACRKELNAMETAAAKQHGGNNPGLQE